MKSKTLLGLRERSSLNEIKSHYKNLMQKWHPDKHKENLQLANDMSAKINRAYEIVMEYCTDYEYPFDEESIKKATQTPQQWWDERFRS